MAAPSPLGRAPANSDPLYLASAVASGGSAPPRTLRVLWAVTLLAFPLAYLPGTVGQVCPLIPLAGAADCGDLQSLPFLSFTALSAMALLWRSAQ